MTDSKIFKSALAQALGAGVYISLVAAFMNNAEYIFDEKPGTLGGVLFLLIFVISAAVMGMLVFGRSTLWYLDGDKKEAVKLAIMTVSCLVLLAISVTLFLILIKAGFF